MAVPISQSNFAEVDGPDNTYVCPFVNVNVGTAATTDIVTLYGSASMIVRVVQIVVMATVAVAAATFDLQVVTRSAAPTVGTAVPLTIKSQDQSDPATTATGANAYTAAPTVSGLVGVMSVQKLFCPLVGALGSQAVFNFGYGAGAKAIVLRGITQGVAINLNGATPANVSSFSGYIMFTERLT